MIYQQQTAVADAPATKVVTTAALGSSLFFSCAAVVATTGEVLVEMVQTAAASFGFSCF